MLLPPTRSTLFPYTTLFRSLEIGASFNMIRGRDGRLSEIGIHAHGIFLQSGPNTSTGFTDDLVVNLFRMNSASYLVQRSEEHTSELQSLRHLVCRLLLEKKK